MSLNTSYTFTGNANWSLDGTSGSASDGGTIQAVIPEGSTVEAAFLYATAFSSGVDPSVNFAFGDQTRALTAADFISLGVTSGFSLEAHRADVTVFVDQIVGDGDADPFDFAVSGMGGSIDGYSLAVVYSNPAEELRTVAFLDGFSDQAGDDFRLAFTTPLEVDADFDALMSLGIGFGFQSGGSSDQFSQVDVNGMRLTTAAGGYDDGTGANGGLNTIGGLGDSPDNPADPNAFPDGSGSRDETQRSDDELYNLARDGFLETGDSSIFVTTANPSNDDNIYFAGFLLDGAARIATAGNDAPVAVNDSATTTRDAPIRIANVLGNDFDPDGDAIELTAVNGAEDEVDTPITLPSGAILTYRGDGAFDYDPNGIAADADSFRYTISDGQASSSARVDIDLTGDTSQAILSITDGTVLEGDSGTTALEFDVLRAGNTANTLTVEIELSRISAENADITGILPQTVTATLNPGDTRATVSVGVVGDVDPEFDEQIATEITAVSTPDEIDFGHSIANGSSVLTILDDDVVLPPPPPPVEADIWGDPHLTTLDGLGYDFQAVGEFILVESTAGDPLTVQVRTTPLNDAVSVISVMATEIDGNTIQIDKDADIPLSINGTPVTIDPLAGPVDVGGGQVFLNADGDMYTIVFANGEQIAVGVYDAFMNVCAFLSDDTDARPLGSVRGLLGNADGDRSDDLALRDGTVLPQPVDFDDLYGPYADSWRISEDEALFDRAAGETTTDFTDTSYPRVVVTLDDLPAQLVADAAAIVDAAGITDPILRDNAILDIALTGDTSFAEGATELAADPQDSTEPANAPDLGAAVGIRAGATQVVEGDDGSVAVQFEVYRIGDVSAPLTAQVAIGGTADAADFSEAFNPDDLTVVFEEDETTQTVIARIAGDTTFEPDETITATLSVAEEADASVIASSAIITVSNDDEDTAPGPIDQTGTPDGETLTGDARDNALDGAGGDDVITGLGGMDMLTGGPGGDTFRDSLANLFGDTITDFTMQDRIVIPDEILFFEDFNRTDIEGGLVAGQDADEDGIVSAAEGVTLQGDFDGGHFLFGTDGTNTVITFAERLPDLAEGVALAGDDVNGVVSDAFLTGSGATDFEVALDARTGAAFDNVLGVYEIDDAGNIVDVRILFDSTSSGTGMADVTDVEAGHQLGFFLVQDGADWFDGLSDGDAFSFVDADGTAGNVADGADLALAVNGVASGQTVFHSFGGASLNADGVTHVTSGATADGTMLLGFEDLTGGGDRDYQDVVLEIALIDNTPLA